MSASSTPKVWGKRTNEAQDGSSPTIFRELSSEQKVKRRREERAEKKERDRTLSYFVNTRNMLLQQSAQKGEEKDAMLSSSVDGFFQELVVLLKADAASSTSSSSSPSSSFHLLRNGVICQTIELALKNASLLHCKSLLFLFLGHVMSLITSPVASYLWETLMASIGQGLSQLADEEDATLSSFPSHESDNTDGEKNQFIAGASDDLVVSAFVNEMQLGGQGTHGGSGLPSTATLVANAVEEITVELQAILSHDIAARTMRSMILALGGCSIRDFPSPHPRVRFPQILGQLATSVVQTVEMYYSKECSIRNPSEIWLAAAQVPAISYIMQSLFQVSEEGSVVREVFQEYLEGLECGSHSLLQELLQGATSGWYVFESYIKVPTPLAVSKEGENAALPWMNQFLQSGSSTKTPPSDGKKRKAEEREKHNKYSISKKKQENEKEEYKVLKRTLLSSCTWGRSVKIMKKVWKSAGSGDEGSNHALTSDYRKPSPDSTSPLIFPLCFTGKVGLQRARFLLQDLAMFSPSVMHLYVLWKEMFLPLLEEFWRYPELLGALAVLVRKVSLDQRGALPLWISSLSHPNAEVRERKPLPAGSAAPPYSEESEPMKVTKEKAQGVRYFTVPVQMQKEICDAICKSFAAVKKGMTISAFLLFHDGREENEEMIAECDENEQEKNMWSMKKGDESVADYHATSAGVDLIRYLLCLHPQASVMMQHSVEKLRLDDLQRAALSNRKTSLALQHYLRAATLSSVNLHSTPSSVVVKKNVQPTVVTASTSIPTVGGMIDASHEKSPAARLFRRILPFIRSWSKHKYGGYVIEELFLVASFPLKEAIVQALKPLYEEISPHQKNAAHVCHPNSDQHHGNLSVEDLKCATILKKVLHKCSVEQYIYRPEEWKKSAQKQCQAQHLMSKITLIPS